jgi:putative hydrolase of the HAD superfamily
LFFFASVLNSETLKNYKHLFFDLDNTLWDFRANAQETFHEIFTTLNLYNRVSDFNKFLILYDQYNEKLWSEYRKGFISKEFLRTERMKLTFHDMGIDDLELINKVGALYIQIITQKTNLFPEVHDTLGYLYKKYNLYILTNGLVELQVEKIKNAGLHSYFRKLFMAEMVGYQKPDHRFFEYAIKSVHARKPECLMIGDDPEVDIIGASKAGIDQVFFNPTSKQCAIEPTWEIGSIAKLMEIL